jgi:hypothetical protein
MPGAKLEMTEEDKARAARVKAAEGKKTEPEEVSKPLAENEMDNGNEESSHGESNPVKVSLHSLAAATED